MNDLEVMYWALEGAMLVSVLATSTEKDRARANAFLSGIQKSTEGGKQWTVRR